jgi:hypothetical protein
LAGTVRALHADLGPLSLTTVTVVAAATSLPIAIQKESSSRNGETRVLKTDRSGKVLGSFGISGRGIGQLAGAHALAVTTQKEIFVAEVFN